MQNRFWLAALCPLWVPLCVPLWVPLALAQVLAPPVDGDGATGEYFGLRLLRDGNSVLLASPLDRLRTNADPLGAESGSVRVMDTSVEPPSERQRLQSLEPQDNLRFGDAMAVSAELLAIGAPGNSSELDGVFAGAVWLYRRSPTGWSLRRILTPPENQNFGNFGQALLLESNRLYVGWPGRDSGRVVVYRVQADDGLTEEAQITSAGLAPTARAGSALLRHEDLLLIGAPGSGQVGALLASNLSQTPAWVTGPASMGSSLLGAGSGRILAGAPGAEQRGALVDLRRAGNALSVFQSLSDATGGNGDRFAESMLSDGNQLWVAAPGADVAGQIDAGVVYRTQLALPTFSAPQAAVPASPSGQFGIAMALDAQNRLLIGEPLARAGALRGGAVRRYLGSDAPSAQSKLSAIRPGQGAQQDIFGWSVSAQGSVAVVGALLRDSALGADSGEAFVFRRQNQSWVLQQSLLPELRAVDQRFGSAVAIDGEHILVGALWDSVAGVTEQGSITPFRLQNGQWLRAARITASQPQARANFGAKAFISGTWAFVAAPAAGGGTSAEGAVYVFRFEQNLWREKARLQGAIPRAQARFGAALASDGQRLIIGAPGESGSQGASYVYQLEGEQWALQQRLAAPEAENFQFGAALAVADEDLWIGAPSTRRSGEAAFGRVHRYRCFPECVRIDSLDPPMAPTGWRFGTTLGISEQQAWVSATGASAGGVNAAGLVYRYRKLAGGWQSDGSLASPRPQTNANFGLALSLSGSLGLIAAPFEAGANPAEGRVDVYSSVSSDSLLLDGFE